MRAKFGPGGNSEAFYLSGFKSTLDAPLYVKQIGLDAYEYEAGNGIGANASLFREIGKRAKEHGVAMSFHTPYFISLSSLEESKRINSIEYIQQSLDAAHLLGAKTIVIHAGSCAKISRNEALMLAKDTLYRALCTVERHGISLGIETMGKINQLGTLDEVLSICEMDRALVPVVDFGHLNARECGGVFKTEEDYFRVFERIATTLGDEVARNLHCHFSMIEWTDKGEKKHHTFERVDFGPPYEPLCDMLTKNNLSPTIICESNGTQCADALLMKQRYIGDMTERIKI